MQIVWDPSVVEDLRQSQTVLELETLVIEGQLLKAYCVVPADKLKLNDYALLDAHKELHQAFVDALESKNYAQCETIAPLLMGQFGGELNTFYEEILRRIDESKTH
jgi:hypothetical protein